MINHNQLLRLILPFFIIFALFASCSNERTVNALIEKAKHELLQGNEARAEQLYIKALKVDPKNETAKQTLAFIYLQKNRLDESEKLAKEIISVNGNNGIAYGMLGWIYMGRGKSEQATDYFKRDIEIRGEKTDSHFGLGQAYRLLGRKEDAENELLKHQKIRPDDPVLYTELGYLGLDLGNLAKAKENFLKAFQLQGGRYDDLMRLGKKYREKGDYQTEMEIIETVKRKIFAPDVELAYKEAKENLRRKEAGTLVQKT